MAKVKLPDKPRVAIYTRVSTLHQIDKDSLPMQRQDLINYARLILNTEDYVVYEDAGYSGKNTDRPKFQEMMQQVRLGMFTHILVWKIDRISRNLLDFATMYSELKQLGVVFVSKNEQFDTSSAMGEAMLKIILIFAELERNMTSERVTAAMLSRAANGQWNGGRVPLGYDYDPETKTFTINESEAAVVKIIHDKYEQERSLVSLARYLNGHGYRTRTGCTYSPSTLLIILRNIFYCGDYRYNVLKDGDRQKRKKESEWITVKDHHPAIISREQKEEIARILKENRRLECERRGIYSKKKNVHVFGGLVICGNCGHAMTSTIRPADQDGIRWSVYGCPTKRRSEYLCKGRATSEVVLGEFVFNYILNMLNVQKNFDSINSVEDMEKMLLSGSTFRDVDGIERAGLDDLYNMLASGLTEKAPFDSSVEVRKKPVVSDIELENLNTEKTKIERAAERLQNLYLYSDDSISQKDYIIQREKLMSQLAEVNEQIGMVMSNADEKDVSDEEFVHAASKFILTQKLEGRTYIYYKRLATTVSREVLRSFVMSIIENITIYDGRVQTIVFKNGLSHTFILK